MTDHPIRFFDSEEAIRRVGEGLLARTLPKAEWTHEAHLAACLWLLRDRPDIVPERDLPGIIRSYNEAVGGVNDDSQGYHETLTQLYIRGIKAFLSSTNDTGLIEAVNALLASDMAPRGWPLRFYSRERLFSVEARRGWVEPDLSAISV
ncbi:MULTISPECIES: hypothetical protein [unclassified Novosphingobium]|uniref:hypothetical protein n=1 Tax=Novosphingobium sp. TaxID=1874826 RepID=UPI000EEBD175|nr:MULTISPECIES: hypothetical protein [unclassified Novosphingobium]HCF25577.1 hypothetical protein [Novosphingobium sp.]HQV04070.1 hypothetical protein [Novosphingobium sp.]